MKPPAFQYFRPGNVTEALQLLREIPGAKLLAGGQSLIPMMNMRLARPETLIDINQLDELTRIEETDQDLVIGALVRHHQLESDSAVRAYAPLIAEAERLIGHAAIRTRGTIGGSLSHADPAAELPVLAVLDDWEMAVRSADYTRVIPASEFFFSYLITALNPDEMLTSIRMPKNPPGGSHIAEYTIRSGDFALAIAAATMGLREDGTIQHLRMALGGVADIPWRNVDLERGFLGRTPGDELFKEISDAVAAELEPADDLHASADYRRQLAGNLLFDSLQRAAQSAREGSVR